MLVVECLLQRNDSLESFMERALVFFDRTLDFAGVEYYITILCSSCVVTL